MCFFFRLRQLQGKRASRVLASGFMRRTSTHGPWLFVTGSALLYLWQTRRKNALVPKADDSVVGLRFASKVVVITGAAGDVGGATAEAFAREGASLVLVDLPHAVSKLGERCEQLQACGAQTAVVFSADMRKEEEVQAVVTRIVETIGPINCFINNAGIQGQFSPVHLQDTEMFRKVIEVNVVGVFLGLKYVSTAMAVSGGGVIVNMASLAGMMGPRYMAAYSASKHAVIGLTKTAAKDLAPSGVRVCAVSPGLLEGKMWVTQVEGKARCDILATTGEDREITDKEKREMENHLLSGTPLRRLGRLSEVAQVVLFLCSEEASYLTGTVLAVDGGRLP